MVDKRWRLEQVLEVLMVDRLYCAERLVSGRANPFEVRALEFTLEAAQTDYIIILVNRSELA